MVPPLEGIGPAGNALTLHFDAGQKATFLFVLSRGCGVCDQTWPTLQQIIAASNRDQFRLAFIATGGLANAPAAAAASLSIPTFTQLDPKDQIALNLRIAPEVLEINARGRLVAAWTGSLQGGAVNEIRSALAIPSSQGDK